MNPHTLYIDGVALWAPALPGWDVARAALRGQPLEAAAAASGAATRPAPPLLPANERRRAPDSVLLALEVAGAALAQSGRAAADVASVFTSAHGDLPITDALCRALATNPLLLSPTRFHHSVHNAASGYWAIGSGSHAASTALSANDRSFAAGLLEAASLCAADGVPVLLVACDTAACGALASVNRSRGMLAVALLLAPQATAASRWGLRWSLQAGNVTPAVLRSAPAQTLAANAMADALPFYEALAAGTDAALALPLSSALHVSAKLSVLGSAGCQRPRA